MLFPLTSAALFISVMDSAIHQRVSLLLLTKSPKTNFSCYGCKKVGISMATTFVPNKKGKNL